MDPTQAKVNPKNRATLVIGSGFLPMLFGDGPHAYRVSKDPLPPDAEIVWAGMSDDLRSVSLLLESAGFPPTAEGCPYHEIRPIFTRIEGVV